MFGRAKREMLTRFLFETVSGRDLDELTSRLNVLPALYGEMREEFLRAVKEGDELKAIGGLGGLILLYQPALMDPRNSDVIEAKAACDVLLSALDLCRFSSKRSRVLKVLEQAKAGVALEIKEPGEAETHTIDFRDFSQDPQLPEVVRALLGKPGFGLRFLDSWPCLDLYGVLHIAHGIVADIDRALLSAQEDEANISVAEEVGELDREERATPEVAEDPSLEETNGKGPPQKARSKQEETLFLFLTKSPENLTAALRSIEKATGIPRSTISRILRNTSDERLKAAVREREVVKEEAKKEAEKRSTLPWEQ